MPENTPIYGFTYPCGTDPITPASFQTLATQIDTQMLSIQSDENWATGRYASRTSAANQAGIASGVETPLTNPGMSYTVLADGVYWVCARGQIAASANLTSSRIRVRRNATPLFGRTYNSIAPNFLSGQSPTMGTMVCVAGDSINVTITYFGTGPATMQSQRLDVRMLVRIF